MTADPQGGGMSRGPDRDEPRRHVSGESKAKARYRAERRAAWEAAGGTGRYIDDVPDQEIVETVSAVAYSAPHHWATAADVAQCLGLDGAGQAVGGRLRRLAEAGRVEYNRGHGPTGWRKARTEAKS